MPTDPATPTPTPPTGRVQPTPDATLRQLKGIGTQVRRTRTAVLHPSLAKFGRTPELVALEDLLRLIEEELAAAWRDVALREAAVRLEEEQDG